MVFLPSSFSASFMRDISDVTVNPGLPLFCLRCGCADEVRGCFDEEFGC